MADRENVINELNECIEHIRFNEFEKIPLWGNCQMAMTDALELLKSMQGVPTWIRAEEPPKDDCECLVLTDDGLKFAEWRDGEWGTWQADFINGGFVDDKWEKLPWTVKFWMYDIVVSNEETED